MQDIIERDLRRLDLNLLLVFHVLMQERHVTRTAARLFLGQPAVSGALKRLRTAFDDPLFVRGHDGLEPTPRALELAPRMEALLHGVREALTARQPFEPKTSTRVFRIGTSEAIGVAVIPRLLERLARDAPRVRVITRDTDRYRAVSMLEHGEIELALGMLEEEPRWLRRRRLFDWRFVCLYDPRRIQPRHKRLSLREFLRHPHLLTSFKGELNGFIDEQLAALGHERRVLFASAHFSTNPFVARSMPVLLTVPDFVARVWSVELGLAISPLPIAAPGYQVSAAWKASCDSDAGLAWLIDVIASICP